jgi:adenylate cyclase
VTSSRQLAAIMFTDIVGYTALMGEDEQKAFALLRKNRLLHKPIIEKFNGHWIKEIGDGILATFPTVTNAVLCAREIQEACQKLDDLRLRIGIHHSEVVFEDNDVFGDGVNIASRLQASAPIGSIWISESVHKNISNNKDIQTKFIRSELLKNVKEPVRIFEVISQADPASDHTHKKSNNLPEKSIAVLPFINMSNDPEQDYFGDGIAEEILNSLTHLQDLKVAGRTSSFQYKSKNLDLRLIGEKLGVRNVMEGSVRKSGNRLRVTVQLINVEDGFHLWSEKYDREMDDIFAIQDEIALAITEKLKITLMEKDKAIITKTHTQNSEAYDLYLKGRFNINRRGRFIAIGMQYFLDAIKIDPNFAPAYAGYSDSCLLSGYYNVYPANEIMPKGKVAALKAIDIDPSLCEPYTSLGFYYEHFEWNFVKSKVYFNKAIELNPSYMLGHAWYGMLYLSWIARDNEEAKKEGWTAIKLEPLSTIAHSLQSVILWVAGEFEEAVRIGNLAIDLDANTYLGHKMCSLAYISLGKYEEAIDMITRTLNVSNRFQWSVFDLMWAYSFLGKRNEMEQLMNELHERASKQYISPFSMALAYAWLGDIDKAIDYLENAMSDREPMLLTILTWPNVPKELLADARCQKIIERIGFPELAK